MIPPDTILSSISSPSDLKKIKSTAELILLSEEIRTYLIETLSNIEHAHFSANLGVVELTVALHYVFETPEDVLFWDIGHQGYVHKMLTGRLDALPLIRTKNQISGFLSREESVYDAFGAGHAGTSISAALGAALTGSIDKDSRHYIAVIGDASLASGMALEALNHLADFPDLNLTVVINDNNCSIDSSVGGLSRHLQGLENMSKHTFFHALGFSSIFSIDGHDLDELVATFQKCRAHGGLNIVHCKTEKGKGFEPVRLGLAAHWHAPGKFDKLSGASFKSSGKQRYQDVFADTLIELANQNQCITAISAGMLSGTSLIRFQEQFSNRCFDVGIAEQHAVTLAAGMASQGFVPFCAIYSTFLQRALDQIIHDVALQNLPVIFCVDRAGLVGHDGATHQGVFDISFLRNIPNLVIASPSNAHQLRNLIYTAQLGITYPLVIRYPRGAVEAHFTPEAFQKIAMGKSKILTEGSDIMILGLGNVVETLLSVKELLSKVGVDAGVCDALFVKPLDELLLHDLMKRYSKVVTVEEHTLQGGFGSAVAEFIIDYGYSNRLLRIGIPDEFVEHASPDEQREVLGLNAEGLATKIKSWLETIVS